MGRHSAQSRSAAPLVAGLAAVALVAGGIILDRTVNGSPDASTTVAATSGGSASAASSTSTGSPSATASSSTASSPTTAQPPVSPTTSAAAVAMRAALTSCASREEAAKPLVVAVSTGAQHWSDHVQAETDLESGARSLIDVKTNTWGPTRAAGPGDVAAYDAATAAWGSAPACAAPAAGSPESADVPADVAAKMQACLTREQALDAWVSAGAAVIQDWRVHLGEMADHADGHINSAAAQANWLERWREAPAHLTPYAAANSALAAAPACAP